MAEYFAILLFILFSVSLSSLNRGYSSFLELFLDLDLDLDFDIERD